MANDATSAGADPEALSLLMHSTFPACGPTGIQLAFSAINRRADLVRAYPELAATCDQLGFHDGTIEEWCNEPWWFLLEIARAAKPPPLPPTPPATAPLAEMVTSITATHHRNLRNELRRLGVLLGHVCLRRAELRRYALPTVFHEFARGMVEHLDHEEMVVFPLCLAIQDANQRHVAGHPRQLAISAAVTFMGEGHEAGAARLDLLRDRVATAQFGISDPDLTLVANGLESLQADLVVHERKEVGIITPAALAAEQQMLDRGEACIRHMREAGYGPG